MKLTETAETVLKRRYYLKDDDGNTIEDWEDLCRRVAVHVSQVEKTEPERTMLYKEFFSMIFNQDFLPNSPCLMNAGTELGQLSACFVLPIEDTLEGIFTSVKNGALVNKTGGGTGYSFSRIRPKDSTVCSTNGVASGPISFAQVFDASTDVIKQGGRRRGANMGVLRCDHPDVLEFIDAKRDKTKLTNFNLSVALTDEFMRKVETESDYALVDPSLGFPVGSLNAKEVFDKIVDAAWDNGEPGVLFIDAANRDNPTPWLGSFEATNPCWTGDTKVWTSEGPVSFSKLAHNGDDVLVLSQDDEGKLCYKMMRKPRRTASSAEVVEIAFDNGTKVRCTPNHNLYLRSGEKKQAKDLVPGDSISSLYRYNANQKGYKRLTNGIEDPLEHHVNVSIPYGRRPAYPDEHCHHVDEDKGNNHWSNLEILPASEHNALNMAGDINPMAGVWDERNPLYGKDVSGENNPNYRHDIDDDVIKAMRESGMSISGIANEVGCSPYTVSKRLGWERPEVVNHKVVYVRNIGAKADVYNGTVDDTHRYFVMCGSNDAILSANCGEQWLLPYESCNLGSINLGHFVKDSGIDWERLRRTVELATRFLDNVVDCNTFPIPEIKEATQLTRKIGLGIMGLHDMLIKLEIPYAYAEGRDVATNVMKFIRDVAMNYSEKLAETRGEYPGYDGSQAQHRPRRNACLTSIQPTGSVSMLADCSSGCEPYFSIVWVKHVMDGDNLLMVNPLFEEIAKREGFYSEELMRSIADNGSVVGNPEVPEKWQAIFATAMDMHPQDHIKMQARLQQYVCSSISKTINLPSSATKDDVKQAYLMGWKAGCKGLTVYRDGCRDEQVMNAGATIKTDVIAPGKIELLDPPIKAELPDVLDSKRFRLKDADGNSIYLILCFDENKQPMEVFAKFPFDNRPDFREKSTQWAVTCRMVSTALRFGIPIEEIIKQLDRASGHMHDLPAQLCKLLKCFMTTSVPGYSTPCPECGGRLIFKEGCESCEECGHSKCS